MPEQDPCEICRTQSATLQTPGYDGIQQRCPRCGEFMLTGTACNMIRSIDNEARTKLSGWIRHQNMLGDIPELSSEHIRLIVSAPTPGIIERANRLLEVAARQQGGLSGVFNIQDPALESATYSSGYGEVRQLAAFLAERGFIQIGGATQATVTPAGFVRLEQLRDSQVDSTQGFVAMWFTEQLKDAYVNGFELGIRNAGYEPLRIDQLEHVGKIDDEIIAQIRRSRFVVADFTGQRGGVYFEAGFAMGLGLPVIWTCHGAEIENLHFDIRQFNCIAWSNPPELAARLQRRIEAVIGAGPNTQQ